VGPWAGVDVFEKTSPPTGIRFPDRPVRSQSLYRLTYLARPTKVYIVTTNPSSLIVHFVNFELHSISNVEMTSLQEIGRSQ
jgi:hypothetical protein